MSESAKTKTSADDFLGVIVEAVAEGWCPFDYERLDRQGHCKVCRRTFSASPGPTVAGFAARPEGANY
jgi:hypothetical protein